MDIDAFSPTPACFSLLSASRSLLSKDIKQALTFVRQEGRSETQIAQVFEDYVFQALVGKQVTLSFLTSGNELGFVTLIVDPESTMETIRAKTTNCIAFLYRWSGSHERHLQVLIGCSWAAGESADVRDTIVAVKLELGPVQTLAHKDASGNWVLNDPPPNKALELAKCQRYMWVSSGVEFSAIAYFEIPYIIDNFLFPVTMRTTPTVTIKSCNGTPGVLSNWASKQDEISDVVANVVTPRGISSLSRVSGISEPFPKDRSYLFGIIADANL